MEHKKIIGIALRATAVALLLVLGIWLIVVGAGKATIGGPPASTAPKSSGDVSSPKAKSTADDLADIDGVPTHVEILRNGKPIEGAGGPIKLIQRGKDLKLAPPAGIVGWYGPPDWPIVPGNLSMHRGVLTGHVVANGNDDVFVNLGKVKAGDTVSILYKLSSGGDTTATFRVTKDAVSAPKDDVIDEGNPEFGWVWDSTKPERVVSILSCDRNARHVAGHSENNWIVQAVREKIVDSK